MKRTVLIFLLAACSQLCMAQRTDRSYVRSGNRLYDDSLFVKAEENYLKAADVNPDMPQASFNLGNTYIAQQKAQEAMEQFRKTAGLLEARKNDPSVQANPRELEKVKKELAAAYHNEGIVFHASEQYDKAVESYKQALRNNPNDDETRYNMILAQKMLKQQQNQQQDQQDQQDQQQDQQDQQQDQQDQQQNQQNQQQDQQDQDEQQQQQQPQSEEMSKENAEQLLQAAMQDEKEVQERVQQQMMQVSPKKQLEKDW